MSKPTPPSPPPVGYKSIRRHHLFSLRVKFILALTILICGVMGAVTWLILTQLQQTLTQQVISRGEAQANSLASNTKDQVLNDLGNATTQAAQAGGLGEDIDMALEQTVHDAMETGSASSATNIPSGLASWQQQLIQSSNILNDMVQNYIWPNENAGKNSDMEYVKIVDKTGKIVADTNLQNVSEHVAYQPPPGTNPLGDQAVLTQAYRDKNRTLYDIAAPLQEVVEGQKSKIGEVHIGMNQNSITRVVRYVAVAIILTTVGVLLLGILFMTIFVTVMIKPVRLLVNGVSAIAAGNFDQKINIRRGDELGDLTQAFNEMAKSLKEKEVMRGAFSKVVTQSVMDHLIQHPDGLKLGGEKKTVTVFFSDIRGFTPMSEALSAEEVVHILNEYFTAMTAIIFKYQGTLDKYMGDAIMAIWGAPIEMQDHAERAVLASIEMGEKMKALQAKWRTEGKREVNIGIGINSGEVVVGNIGSNERLEYTAIGDNVNLTQRLESVAEKGQILISAATYERVKHKVDAIMLDPIKVKGKTEKVVAYSVQGLKS